MEGTGKVHYYKRHLRKHHPRLPTTQEAENARIRQLESTSTGVGTLATPFSLAAAQGTGQGVGRGDLSRLIIRYVWNLTLLYRAQVN